MTVLVDMEWIEAPKGCYALTQLAALRVNEAWETVDSFNEICRPMHAGRKHVGD